MNTVQFWSETLYSMLCPSATSNKCTHTKHKCLPKSWMLLIKNSNKVAFISGSIWSERPCNEVIFARCFPGGNHIWYLSATTTNCFSEHILDSSHGEWMERSANTSQSFSHRLSKRWNAPPFIQSQLMWGRARQKEKNTFTVRRGPARPDTRVHSIPENGTKESRINVRSVIRDWWIICTDQRTLWHQWTTKTKQMVKECMISNTIPYKLWTVSACLCINVV